MSRARSSFRTTRSATFSSKAQRPDYPLISTVDFAEGRFFNDLETRSAANVCLLGYDVADALFASASPIDKNVLINGQQFKVIGVGARQGSFLGLFSLDSIVIIPLPAFKKFFSNKSESDVRVKVKDKPSWRMRRTN